ncbi:MAG: hypothetical protein ACJAS4_002917 [Bacteriovoracaceae bacterium]|jgi:hypothetical protein
MEKINNSIKIKLICLLFFSNISVYLLSSEPIEENHINIPQLVERKGYIEMRIRGNLLTSFSPNKAITLISKSKHIYIPFAILTGEVNTPHQQTEFSNSPNSEIYSVYLPERYLPLLISNPLLSIIPYAKNNISKAKRRNYEISI